MNRNPPRLAAALLNLIVPEEERESIPGDLAEELVTENRSRLWYWRQVMQSTRYLAGRSLRESGLGILGGGGVMCAGIFLIEIAARNLLPVITRIQPVVFGFTLTLLAVGVASAVAGGYIAARLGGDAGKLPPLVLGALFVAITGLWLVRGVGAAAPTWFRGGLILLVLPSAFFGGRLQTQRSEDE